jgi:hydrogenase expression/formation protein HypE
VPVGRRLSAQQVRVGDRIVLSGTIGDHGMSVMMARGDLDIEAEIESDTAPVHEMVEALLAAAPNTRWMRDPTRGGLGTICNELAQDTGLAVILDEQSLPVAPMVQGACDMLGIDPLYVANEGKFIAVVPPDEVDAAISALRGHPLGRAATVIGEIIAEPEGVVALRTAFGGTRIVDMLVGDPLQCASESPARSSRSSTPRTIWPRSTSTASSARSASDCSLKTTCNRASGCSCTSASPWPASINTKPT